jgi:alpha-beta hydrolase superfamily lysophospholipase
MRQIQYIAVVLVLVLLAGCADEYEQASKIEDYPPSPAPREEVIMEAETMIEPINAESVTFTTEDSMEIFGKYYPAEGDKAIILLHMLNKDHTSWNLFAAELNNQGYNVLAIDLRGHGKSNVDWKEFGDEQFIKMGLDVKQAKQFMFHKNSRFKFVVMGASIGANLALNNAVEDKEVIGVALLSPGLEYRGIKIEQTMLSYGQRPILLAASEEDKYSHEAVLVLNEKLVGEKRLIVYKNAGHGTDMLKMEEKLSKEIFEWLEEVFVK